jgi:hypothetical protein
LNLTLKKNTKSHEEDARRVNIHLKKIKRIITNPVGMADPTRF